MSHKNQVEVLVFPDKESYICNEKITGYIEIRNHASVDITINSTKINVSIAHGVGKGYSYRKMNQNIYRNKQKVLKKGASFRQNFELEPVYNVSFRNDKFEQKICLCATIDLNKKTEDLLFNQPDNIIKKENVGWDFSYPGLSVEKIIQVDKGDVNYVISKGKGEIAAGQQQCFFVMAGTILYMIVASATYMNDGYLALKIASILYVLFFLYLWFRYARYTLFEIGFIKFALKNAPGNYCNVSIHFPKKIRNILKIESQFIVKEGLEESERPGKIVLYEGEKHTITKIQQITKFKMPFPEDSIPAYISNLGFEINWSFRLYVYLAFFKQPLIGEEKIEVRLEKDLPTLRVPTTLTR